MAKSRRPLIWALLALIVWEVGAALYFDNGDFAHSKSLSAHARKEFEAARTYGWIAAHMGSTDAAALLGTMYMRGEGGPIDGEKAVYWLERAANNGNVTSESILGLMYATGQGGVPLNESKAKFWFMRAANHGDAFSRSFLNRFFRAAGST